MRGIGWSMYVLDFADRMFREKKRSASPGIYQYIFQVSYYFLCDGSNRLGKRSADFSDRN